MERLLLMDKITRTKLSSIYYRLDIDFIRSAIGYRGSKSVLRKRITSGSLSDTYIESILSLKPHLKDVETVPEERSQALTKIVEGIGYSVFAEYIGENKKRFTMEMYGYLHYMDRTMSTHRFEYIKSCLNRYCRGILRKVKQI